MDCLEALILGVIQGLTEFLPVSSSGHLQIGSALLGITVDGNLTFDIVVHAATVLSVIVALRKEILDLLQGLFRFQWNDQTRFIAKLAVSAVPVALAGIFFEEEVEKIFSGSLMIVGAMLLLTAALLTFACYAKPRRKERISFADAFIIGVAQACAVMPGLSRSGTTIATGMILGNQKEATAKFSFLMLLAPVMGKCLLDWLSGNFASAASGIPAMSLLTGFAAAFVTGLLACTWMLALVKKGKLIYFAVYCAFVGMAVLVFG
ncbi:MAG: undecaprenyl-diphosphate phosphatase [Bacteroidales bacterium]|jgi:undecaprenyl-diphosphatase|nr:undecaprenyl-diphosphate phosphatase [Bacteroidales bacterium]